MTQRPGAAEGRKRVWVIRPESETLPDGKHHSWGVYSRYRWGERELTITACAYLCSHEQASIVRDALNAYERRRRSGARKKGKV